MFYLDSLKNSLVWNLVVNIYQRALTEHRFPFTSPLNIHTHNHHPLHPIQFTFRTELHPNTNDPNLKTRNLFPSV